MKQAIKFIFAALLIMAIVLSMAASVFLILNGIIHHNWEVLYAIPALIYAFGCWFSTASIEYFKKISTK